MPHTASCPTLSRTASHARERRLACYLECASDAGGYTHKVPLTTFPFSFGRSDQADFVIPCGQISRVHAEIYRTDDGMRIRDLGSTNGTFVNGRRVKDTELVSGAIVHLAHREFRFVSYLEEDEIPDGLAPKTHHALGGPPESLLHSRTVLEELIRQRFVQVFFQPVLDLRTRCTLGYEALGRGTHGNLTAKPYELFRLAERCGLAGELSRLLRMVAVAEAVRLPSSPVLFLNVHPSELEDPVFLDSVRTARAACPAGQALVVEIHEDTVTDVGPLRHLRAELHKLNVRLAYDDFGTGQARLAELAEVPPDYLKLNISLVRDLHRSPARQKLLRTINRVAQDLGVRVIAEGIETVEEADICADLGCQFGQGYLFGHPGPAPSTGDDGDTWEVEFASSGRHTRVVEIG